MFFLPRIYFAQNLTFDTLKFYNHLKQNHLFNEQLAFNKILQKTVANNPIIVDSLKLDIATIYYQLNLPDSCKNTLLSISNHFNFSEIQNHQYLSMLIVNKEYATAQKIIKTTAPLFLLGKEEGNVGVIKTDKWNDNIFQRNIGLSIAIFNRELDRKDSTYNSFSVSPTLFEIKSRYLNPPTYSPAMAGIYSALIPGMGKLYIGYKKQALSSFIANMLLAAQTAESYFKSGYTSPRFIITASVFSIFYTGNIIGSIAMARKKKKDYFKQLDDEIFNYYAADVNKFIN